MLTFQPGHLVDGNPEAMQGLLGALDDPQPTVRSRVADALGDVTTTGESELRALQAASKDDYRCVHAAAERAIRQIEWREQPK